MVNNAMTPLVLLTSSLPRAGSDGDLALRAVGPTVIFDAIELQADQQTARLKFTLKVAGVTGPKAVFGWTMTWRTEISTAMTARAPSRRHTSGPSPAANSF